MLQTIVFFIISCLISVNSFALPINMESGKAEMLSVMQKFKEKGNYYKSGQATGEIIEEELSSPFFQALGWDINNTRKSYLYARDVVPYQNLKVGLFDQYITYSFQIDGHPKFYASIIPGYVPTNNRWYIYNLKRLAWSAGIEIAVLSNFNETRVFDTTIKPDISKPDDGQLLYLKSDYYLNNFNDLWSTFSRESVASGSLERLIKRTRTYQERVPMDKSFLSDWDDFRLKLAENIYKNNKISEEQLNKATNHILNELLFARILEDRGIEPTDRLREALILWEKSHSKSLINKVQDVISAKLYPPILHKADNDAIYSARYIYGDSSLYAFLRDEFNRLEKRFNGVIFKKHMSNDLKIDDDVLKNIITNLYPPISPYNFSAIDISVLGELHERYLAKELVIENKTVLLPKRPSIRQASGAFYTPKWIVDYIMDQTIEKKLDGKNAKEAGAIKLLDPSCGSGAFTTAMVQRLFDHIIYYYSNNQDSIGNIETEFPDAYKLNNGSWKLSARKKADIVQNSLVCVDFDSQAVENTKMWLYILILEHEGSYLPTEARGRSYKNNILPENLEEFALPDLKNNVINGNSLIATNFSNNKEELNRVKAFNWDSNIKLAEIIKNGGFDVVATNPPYISSANMRKYIPDQYDYLRKNYISMSDNQPDLSYGFLEKGLSLLKSDGFLGYITTNRFLLTDSGKNLRDLLYKSKSVKEIVNISDPSLFEGVTVYPAIIILENKPQDSFRYSSISNMQNYNFVMNSLQNDNYEDNNMFVRKINSNQLELNKWGFTSAKNDEILKNILKQPLLLKDIAEVFSGIITGSDKIFVVTTKQTDGDKVLIHSKATGKDYWIEKDILHPILFGGDVKRYKKPVNKKWLILPYDNKYNLYGEEDLKKIYPGTYEYLLLNKDTLLKRSSVDLAKWYGFSSSNKVKQIFKPKLVTGWSPENTNYSLDNTGIFAFPGSGSRAAIYPNNKDFSKEALLGIINSKTIKTYIETVSPKFTGGYAYSVGIIENIPIAPVNNKTNSIYKKIDQAVRDIIKNNDANASAHLEAKIDLLVKELYEIK